MKISTFAFRGITDQISRIEEGFRALGCEIVEDNPDIIYSNNALYDSALAHSQKWPKAKKIFTVLDIPFHSGNYPFNLLQQQLSESDAIVTISYTVQKQILEYFNFDSQVIYQPIKPIYRVEGMSCKFLFLYVGRCNDPQKDFALIKRFILQNNFNEEDLFVIGSERPDFGKYLGIVTDETLNLLYNQAEYVFLPSFTEGMGLSVLEGIMAGCKPIVCKDNPTAVEFFGDITLPRDVKLMNEEIHSIDWQIKVHKFMKENAPIWKKQFSGIEVARRILEVYKSL